MSIVISVENLSKVYQLGGIGTGTFSNDLKVWWATKVLGKPNPLLKIGERTHGNRDGEELWALRNISFSVNQGEVLGIIGRNGAGKSTLLKILSRVTAPTSGKIKVKGRIASLLEVGTGFHPELTGRENIHLNGAILGMSRSEIGRKFDEIVGFSEVEKFIDTPVKRYSSGMYVRLAFAVAAHLDPEILIIDEVLAVGDAEFQKKCLGKMGDVAKEGRTVLFVSHNMGAIRALCTNALLLKQGIIHQYGVCRDVVGEYLENGNEFHLGIPESIIKNRKIYSDKINISFISMQSVLNENKNNFCVWEPFKVVFELDVQQNDILASCWLFFKNSEDQVVYSTFQYDFADAPSYKKGHYRCSVIIQNCNLIPGSYSYSAGIFGRYNEFYDWIDSVGVIHVEPQLYPTGKPFDKRLGITTGLNHWEISDDS